jgi:hypothetical protein
LGACSRIQTAREEKGGFRDRVGLRTKLGHAGLAGRKVSAVYERGSQQPILFAVSGKERSSRGAICGHISSGVGCKRFIHPNSIFTGIRDRV